jgi:DNA-binding transcriptional LysR family regulator
MRIETAVARPDLFTGISEFLAVARLASFRAAAAELRVTSAAVSQAIRALEVRVGLPLFQRTTRRVTLTEVGNTLFARLQPAAADIGGAFEHLRTLRARPTGHLRLSVPHIAVDLVIAAALPAFRRACPEVSVEVSVNDASVDLTAGRFDAGIRIGEFIERDMVAIKLTPDFRWCVVGSPSYFAERGSPRSPGELAIHECICYRFPTAQSVYRWEFHRNGREFSFDPKGGLVVDDHLTMVALAKQGMGLAYTADLVAARALASGELQSVLRPYLPVKPGLFLYFPARNQNQPKVRAFIEAVTTRLKRRSR